MKKNHRLPGIVVVFSLFASTGGDVAVGQEMSSDAAAIGTLTCQQLWYVENEVLKEGRICPKSNRARQAFGGHKTCISDDERILPKKTADYLASVREIARRKGCSGD